MDVYLQILVNGLLLGGLYGLIAMGLALVFGVMGVINVAHGALMIVGATVTYLLFSALGWPPYISLLLVVPALFAIGLATQRFLLERIDRSDELMSLLLLFGLAVAVSQGMASVVGAEYFSVPYWRGSLQVGGLFVSEARLYSFVLAIAIAGLMFYFLHRTAHGRAIRATSMAPDLAAATGVDVRWIRLLTFGIGSSLAGAAGVLLVTSQGTNALSGEFYLLIAFAACVLGGLGSVAGALVAGLILGVIEVAAAILVDTQSSQLAIYLVFILMLLVRPSGLFGVRRA